LLKLDALIKFQNFISQIACNELSLRTIEKT